MHSFVLLEGDKKTTGLLQRDLDVSRFPSREKQVSVFEPLIRGEHYEAFAPP